MFIQRITSARLTSNAEHVERSIQLCLIWCLPAGVKAAESDQILITFRQGTSLIQPRAKLRENIILCVTYENDADDNDNRFHASGVKVSNARFCSLYRNESTNYQWTLGENFVIAHYDDFEEQPLSEQLIQLGFHP